MKAGVQFGAHNNEIIYAAAAVGVKQNLEKHSQEFFGGLPYEKLQEKYTPGWPCH